MQSFRFQSSSNTLIDGRHSIPENEFIDDEFWDLIFVVILNDNV
jgi:hypothetical protein